MRYLATPAGPMKIFPGVKSPGPCFATIALHAEFLDNLRYLYFYRRRLRKYVGADLHLWRVHSPSLVVVYFCYRAVAYLVVYKRLLSPCIFSARRYT